MFCKRLSLRFAVPAFLSKLLYSELKSLKINRRIRLFKSNGQEISTIEWQELTNLFLSFFAHKQLLGR